MEQITLFDEEAETGIQDGAPEFIQDAWRKAMQDRRKNFAELQQLSYEEKLERQAGKAWEFYDEMQKRGYSCHVSVGGLDSITLLVWLHSIGIHVPAISVSSLEDKGNQTVHRALGIEIIKRKRGRMLRETGAGNKSIKRMLLLVERKTLR